MTTKEQYKVGYSLVRSQSWDFITFKITSKGLGISDRVRLAILRSYLTSLLIDEIGEEYRQRVYGGLYND